MRSIYLLIQITEWANNFLSISCCIRSGASAQCSHTEIIHEITSMFISQLQPNYYNYNYNFLHIKNVYYSYKITTYVIDTYFDLTRSYYLTPNPTILLLFGHFLATIKHYDFSQLHSLCRDCAHFTVSNYLSAEC